MKKTMDKAKHFAHEVRLHGGREGGGASRDGGGREGGSAEEGLDEQANIKVRELKLQSVLCEKGREVTSAVRSLMLKF